MPTDFKLQRLSLAKSPLPRNLGVLANTLKSKRGQCFRHGQRPVQNFNVSHSLYISKYLLTLWTLVTKNQSAAFSNSRWHALSRIEKLLIKRRLTISVSWSLYLGSQGPQVKVASSTWTTLKVKCLLHIAETPKEAIPTHPKFQRSFENLVF